MSIPPPLSQAEVRRRCGMLRAQIDLHVSQAREGFARAMRPGNPNTFTWCGDVFWVDQVRTLIVPAGWISNDWRAGITLPDDGELGETIGIVEKFYGEYRTECSARLGALFGWLLRGVQARHVWSIEAGHFLNLCIAQPFVNPAFGPLFWLAMAQDLAPPPGPIDNFYDLVGPMLVDPTVAPQSRGIAQARKAQVEFLESFAGRPIPGAPDLSDDDWSAFCATQAEEYWHRIELGIFYQVWPYAGSLADPHALPLPWDREGPA